jgi:Domain of unknown function (DUF4280)
MPNKVKTPAPTDNKFEAENKAASGKKIVIDGATIKCDSCIVPLGKMKVNFDTPTIQNKKVATVKENGAKSIQFFGNCKNSPKMEIPCKTFMFLGEWKKVGNMKVQEQFPLLQESTIKCSKGGTVSIQDSGQINIPEQINKLDSQLPPPELLAKCIVHFRPNVSWRGEDFGFDWFRTGDTSLLTTDKKPYPGDLSYEKIVGNHYDPEYKNMIAVHDNPNFKFKVNPELYNKLKRVYRPHIIPWKTTEKEYFVPWLSLYPTKIAKLSIVLDIEEAPDVLRFEPNPNFKITPNEFAANGKGKLTIPINITIECLKEFDSDQTIVLNAVKNGAKLVAGKINVWSNEASKQKKAKLLFLKVILPPMSNPTKSEIPDISDQKDLFNKYLKQAYVESNPNEEVLDLSTDKNFLTGGVYNMGGKVAAIYNDYKMAPKDFEALEVYLYKKLKAQLAKVDKTLENKYAGHSKFIYIKESGGQVRADGTLFPNGGYASGNGVMVFKGAPQNVAAHEFMHYVGMPHSFDNLNFSQNAKYTYQFCETDNVMDYSHSKGKLTFSTWKWQWEITNNNTE